MTPTHHRMPTSLTVTGIGHLLSPPDLLVFSLELTGIASIPEQARRQLISQREKLFTAFRHEPFENLLETHLRRSTLSLVPERSHDSASGSYRLTGFRATEHLTLRLPRTHPAVDRIFDVLASELDPLDLTISYELSDRGAAERRALQLAVADARDRATLIAEAAGYHLGALLELRHPSRDPEIYAHYDTASDLHDPSLPTTAPEDSLIEAQISAVWEIHPTPASHST